MEKSIMFEISYTDLQHLTASFEYPGEDAMVTVEFNLANIQAVSCTTFTPPGHEIPYLQKDTLLSTIMRK